jgi:hypothetical protein
MKVTLASASIAAAVSMWDAVHRTHLLLSWMRQDYPQLPVRVLAIDET